MLNRIHGNCGTNDVKFAGPKMQYWKCGTENAGPENAGPKMQGWKIKYRKCRTGK